MSKLWDTVRRLGWRILKFAVVVVLIVGIVYWVQFAPVSVTQHQIEQGEIVAEVMGTGTLEAHVQATVSSKISGRIAQVLVDQGDRVQIGQLLVRLDDEELSQQVAIAQANREAVQAAIDRLKADKGRATAVANRSRIHHARVLTLIEKKWPQRKISTNQPNL